MKVKSMQSIELEWYQGSTCTHPLLVIVSTVFRHLVERMIRRINLSHFLELKNDNGTLVLTRNILITNWSFKVRF